MSQHVEEDLTAAGEGPDGRAMPDSTKTGETTPVKVPSDTARTETGVSAYKAILQRVLDNRPSGTRLRLAGALGKNRSFVSQITNPAYLVPIPARHVDVILEECSLSPAEREAFLKAYGEAHPGRRGLVAGRRQMRTVTLVVPDLGDARRNRAYDRLLGDLAERLAQYGDGER